MKRLVLAFEKDEARFVVESLRAVEKIMAQAISNDPHVMTIVGLSGTVVLTNERNRELQARIDKAIREQCE